MSALQLKGTNAIENEFLGENSLITVISHVDHPQFLFLSGNFGPLTSGMPCDIPLWLAITLRKKGLCTIKTPDWMTIEALETSVSNERTQKILGNVPFQYMEIAQLLLTNARDDIQAPDKVSVLLQDLEGIRMDRIRQGVLDIAESINNSESVVSAALKNVSSQEILTMKRFFLGSMNTFYKLCPLDNAPRNSRPAYDDGTDLRFGQTEGNTNGVKKLRKYRTNNN
eukprot:gene13276-17789_t